MAATFKVDGFDLSTHLRVNQGDGLTPYPQGFLEPQFAEGALSDGDQLISIHEGNREQAWTVILNPAAAGYTASKDGLHQLIRDVNRVVKNAQTIEWRDDGATSSTYFDVRFARFDPDWDYRRSQQLWVAGAIKAWTRPYGHTGTTRVVATAAGSLAAAQLPMASGALAGDADGDMFATLSLATAAQENLLIGYSVGPATGWVPIWPAASLTITGTLVGASGAYASQAARALIGASGTSLSHFVSNPVVPSGPHRVIALARTTTPTAQGSAVVLHAEMLPNGPIGPTQVLPTGRGWRVVDLGSFNGGTTFVPNTIAYNVLGLYSSLLSASAGASGSIDVGAVLVVPEGRTVVALTSTVGMLAVDPVATYTFDGLGRSVLGANGTPTVIGDRAVFDSYVRGDFPRLPVGSGCNVVAFALPDDQAQNRPVSVEIRCRERFTYAR